MGARCLVRYAQPKFVRGRRRGRWTRRGWVRSWKTRCNMGVLGITPFLQKIWLVRPCCFRTFNQLVYKPAGLQDTPRPSQISAWKDGRHVRTPQRLPEFTLTVR